MAAVLFAANMSIDEENWRGLVRATVILAEAPVAVIPQHVRDAYEAAVGGKIDWSEPREARPA